MRRLTIAGIAAVFVALGAGACGTDAVGIEACRQIEEARCRSAPNCPNDFNLAFPVHRGDDVSANITSCIRFYREACLHGVTTPPDPGAVRVKACVDAINEAGGVGDCAVVKNPEVHPSCAFLSPPPPPPAPPPDAGAAADAVPSG